MNIAKRRRYLWLLLPVLFLAFGLHWLQGELRTRAWNEERYGFVELNILAVEMVREGEDGVVVADNGTAYIESFDDFFAYVKQRQPERVSTVDAPNPFPGLLPGERYERLDSLVTQPDQLLFWSTRVFDRPSGRYQHGIRATGRHEFLLSREIDGSQLTR